MPPNVGQGLAFLRDAADPKSQLRRLLEKAPSAQVEAKLKSTYGLEDRVPALKKRRVPSISACREMAIDAQIAYEAYEASASAPSGLELLMRAEGHAMPLAVTGEDEVAAAGEAGARRP